MTLDRGEMKGHSREGKDGHRNGHSVLPGKRGERRSGLRVMEVGSLERKQRIPRFLGSVKNEQLLSHKKGMRQCHLQQHGWT